MYYADGMSFQLAGPAAVAVVNTTELLEHVLQYVAIATLLPAQRVCHTWQDIISRLIHTNIILRKRLFLEPASLDEILHLRQNDHRGTPQLIDISGFHHDQSIVVALANPYLPNLQAPKRARRIACDFTAGYALRKDMQVSQPSVTALDLELMVGDEVSTSLTPMHSAETG